MKAEAAYNTIFNKDKFMSSMIRTTLLLSALLVMNSAFSQKYVTDFIYGKMVKENDTLVGYFKFNHDITQNGQQVYYKKQFESESSKSFPSRRYDYFESDSFYLETFGVVPMLTGDVLIMIPRIINGKLQLFAVNYNGGGFLGLGHSETLCIKKGSEKLRLKKSKFKKQMHQLLDDDEALLQKIDNDELKYEDLIEIVKSYNNHHPL